MDPPIGSPERPLRVAVVGAGPSGFYTTGALLQNPDLTVRVDLFDRLPAPYGLVRYGVAPDHPKIKAVSRVFERLAGSAAVRFFGNVDLGRDLSRAELRRFYHQVVYAVGGQTDRRLGIPGEDLPGSYSSTELVAWYSGHPDFMDFAVDLEAVERVAVVGIGNVAMDIARVLAKTADQMAGTDIADPALEALRGSRIREVHVLARRGPVQAKCSPPELKEIGAIEGVDVLVDPRDLKLDAASATALVDDRSGKKNMALLEGFAGATHDPEHRRIRFRFLTSPVEIVEKNGRVGALEIERNRLEPTESGYLASVGTGETETLPVEMVVRAVGYRSVPLEDLPFDDRRGVIPNDQGRILDPATGDTLPGEYVVGWVKRGPTGLIGSNKPDAVETVEKMIEDLPGLESVPPDKDEPEAIVHFLEKRGVRIVDFADWQSLDALEKERGEAEGRPRVKFCRVEEMLAALDGAGDASR